MEVTDFLNPNPAVNNHLDFQSNSLAENVESFYTSPARSTRSRSRSASVQRVLVTGKTTSEEQSQYPSTNSRVFKTITNRRVRFESGEDDRDYYDPDPEDIIVEEDEDETLTKTTRIYNKVSRISRSLCRLALNVVCVPIYWSLVQIFVLEKWLLNRSPPPPPPVSILS